MKKIFVGNLSWKVTEEDLRPLFEQFGTVVSLRIVTDPYTQKSKGFGFVEMADSDAVQKAIKELDNTIFMERSLRVSLAHDRPPRREGGDREGRSERGDRGGFQPRRQHNDGNRFERNYAG